MDYLSDIEISKKCELKRIQDVANEVGISEDYLEYYGKYKAKIDTSFLKDKKEKGKLILVTAITPTPAGEGKTTTTIGLADALRKTNEKVVVALREPSLGPVFGIKGGATGGGYAQVVPMEDINLHFTGDFHAIGAANNLLCAMIDNHIHQGNTLNIDPRTIKVTRCVDMNDRQLRKVVTGLGKGNGMPREEGFEITVASEVMAVFCLANSLSDLKERLGKIICGYTFSGEPIFAKDLKANGAMAALLKDAIKPNLVQTLEHTPALIHGGPFANIAHGCNSVIATKTALKLGDYVVTEAGFGCDLGAEKFIDIKGRNENLVPDCTVLVCTIRALKMHGGQSKEDLKTEDCEKLKLGFSNLVRHYENLTKVFKLKCVVALNKFPFDTENELNTFFDLCKEHDIKAYLSNVWEKGGDGAIDLANEVKTLCNEKNEITYPYELNDSIYEKIEKIVRLIYRGDGIVLNKEAKRSIANIEKMGYANLPICMSKTQYSFSDDATKINAPNNFIVTIRDVKLSFGAGFIVVYAGDILTMPGLPKVPSAESIDVDENGEIVGIF